MMISTVLLSEHLVISTYSQSACHRVRMALDRIPHFFRTKHGFFHVRLRADHDKLSYAVPGKDIDPYCFPFSNRPVIDPATRRYPGLI
jgi:hypothetical protein